MANDKNFKVKNGLDVGGSVTLTGSSAIIFDTLQQGSGGEIGLRGSGEGFQIYEPEESSKVWLTIDDDPAGSNTAFKINSTSGMVPVFHDLYHPNADKWTTARTITLTGDVTGSTSIDGSANVSITTTVANDSHSHSNYLIKTGDTMTGALTISSTVQNLLNIYNNTNAGGATINFSDNSGQGQTGQITFYHSDGQSPGSAYGASFKFNTDQPNLAVILDGTGDYFVGTNKVFHDGYHPNADKWTTARTNTVTLTGSVTGTGSASVDGSGNWTVTVPTTTNHTHNYDNYGSWIAKDHDGTTYTVTSGDTLWFKEGGAIDVNFTADDELTISHADTSTQASVNNSNGTVIQDITLDTYGHITAIGSVNLDGRYQLIAAPAAPSITSTTLSGETVEIVFAQSATSGVNGYEIWSDGGGVSFALIGRIPAQDIAASMSFVDTTFTDTGTINYRVYAIRNGVYSTAATTTATFSVPSLDVANFAAIPDLNAFHLQYDLPVTRFLDHIEIYLDTNAASGSLARANATLIYSGDNSSYTHNISASDRDNYHQFWVECVGVA